ncbi:MAG TPA: 5-amino-6-(D-ribitylamino)uracil--L-tyrosine 4-hydroxyphenyl transferase CofH [Solirubrobacterales bacterium]|nr:5-amino-6-(D-ribitylamino)uracil--L-tyrosine 4-hydroxyphenyl transferase CofH [Solirubrobacterales bacterium]
MRRVTFSRNYTLSLSRTCRCYCKYCAFATHRAHLYEPDEVEARLDEAVRRRAKELLVLTGERPEVNPEVARRLRELGHEDFVSYVVWTCERALERGLLPHTNLGVLSREDLGRLREVTASQGLMLESISERLMETVHAGSPTKHPARRLETIAAAGELRIPFTSGILVGIGETVDERIASLGALAAVHERYGHVQEVILQNFVPHPNYYGREVAEIADGAAREKWAGGSAEPSADRVSDSAAHTGSIAHSADRQSDSPLIAVANEGDAMPDWATPINLEDMKLLVRECRRLMPDVGIQIPPNLSDWWADLVEEGATDLGGLSANGDHISPEQAFPSPPQVRRRLAPRGYAVSERLCAYPQFLEPEWIEQGVLDVVKLKYWSFIPRKGSGRRSDRAIDPDEAPRAIEKGRRGEALSGPELTALFAETRPDVIEEMRSAADELRAELAGETVTFVVNRNVNFTNICVVGCAFCGFGQGRRSPDAYHVTEHDFQGRVQEAVDYGATEICMQGGIHPDYTLEHYGRWLRLAKEVAPPIHLHAYSPMEIHYMCDRSGKSPEEVFDYLAECGLGSTPGTAAEVLHDGVRTRISPNKLPVARWVEIIEACHRSGLRSTSTVMFGHIEEPWELAQHMRVVRELQERTGGITEFVPLSFIPFNTLLGRTHGVEEISREENLKHTAAFRLALGKTIPNLQASWVKMGLEAATESLRWGVNDLGGTLMEENISRMAGSHHGVRLDPPQLIAAARKAGRRPAQRTTLYEIVETY